MISRGERVGGEEFRMCIYICTYAARRILRHWTAVRSIGQHNFIKSTLRLVQSSSYRSAYRLPKSAFVYFVVVDAKSTDIKNLYPHHHFSPKPPCC